MQINIHSNFPEFKSLGKYLKEKYNLKMVGLIKFLLENPEELNKLNELIPKDDINFRFREKN